MALKIKWTKRAEKSFDNIVTFIENKWSEKSAEEFVKKTNRVLTQISEQPEIFEESEKKGIRKGLIARKTSVFYRIYQNYIRLLFFWDNRRDPNKLKL